MKQWTLYHGTSKESARKILREGLKTSFLTPIFLTPLKSVALQYAINGARYPSRPDLNPKSKRTPVVLQVTITESDIKRQNASSKIKEIRIRTLDNVVKNKIREYLYYENIPANKIRRINI